MENELEQLGERIAEQAAHLDAATHRLLADLRVFDERGGWRAQGALSCAHWLSWRVGWGLGTARDHVRVARKIGEFAEIDDALRRGEVSYSKVRAMLRIATRANEHLLLEYARLMTGSQLEETCRKYALVLRHGQDPHPLGDLHRRYVRRRDTEDGMVKIEAVLHAEEAELVWTMLNHAAAQLTRNPEASAPNVPAETQLLNEVRNATLDLDTRSSRVPLTTAGASSETTEPSPTRSTAAAVPSTNGPADRGDVSAETRDAAIGHRTAHRPVPCIEGTTNDVSAEAREPSQARSMLAAVSSTNAGADRGDVSAETRDAAIGHCTARRPVPCVEGTTNDVSAAATEPSQARDMMAAAPSSNAGADRGDVSAETRDAAIGHPTARRPVPCVERTTNDVSAAAAEPSQARSTAAAVCCMNGSADHGDVSEETRDSGVLDRLLDEAEMLRAAEADQSTDCEAGLAEAPGPSGTGVLHQRADATRRAFDRADAMVSLAQEYLRGNRPNRAPIEVVLTVPASSLRTGGLDPVEVGEIGESFVSGEAARRISCDCGVVEVIEDEHGTPLSVGRKRRTITGMLKRALVKRDKTCTYPGCTNRLFLEGHHVQHWADGGETSLSNAALLCSTHHHYVHEYGYSMELGPDHRPQFRDPHGRLVASDPERPVAADLGWPRIRAANEPLRITADTIACEWDGTPVNYGAIIGHLVVADRLQ
jgi:hypothetical protein